MSKNNSQDTDYVMVLHADAMEGMPEDIEDKFKDGLYQLQVVINKYNALNSQDANSGANEITLPTTAVRCLIDLCMISLQQLNVLAPMKAKYVDALQVLLGFVREQGIELSEEVHTELGNLTKPIEFEPILQDAAMRSDLRAYSAVNSTLH